MRENDAGAGTTPFEYTCRFLYQSRSKSYAKKALFQAKITRFSAAYCFLRKAYLIAWQKSSASQYAGVFRRWHS